MIVVDVEGDVLPRWPPAEKTAAALQFQHGLVLLNRDAILPHQVASAFLQLHFGLETPSSVVRIDLLRVGLLPAPRSRFRWRRVGDVAFVLRSEVAGLAVT